VMRVDIVNGATAKDIDGGAGGGVGGHAGEGSAGVGSHSKGRPAMLDALAKRAHTRNNSRYEPS
jgi:hypothetical protein